MGFFAFSVEEKASELLSHDLARLLIGILRSKHIFPSPPPLFSRFRLMPVIIERSACGKRSERKKTEDYLTGMPFWKKEALFLSFFFI